MTDFARMADAERKTLYAELQELTDAQLSTMTVCVPRTVRHVVAHLTALGHQSVGHFFGGMLRSGFNFDKFIQRDLVKFNVGTNADLLARFAGTVNSPRNSPGPKYVALGEFLCHGEDIRRALNRQGEHPQEHVVALAEEYRKTGKPLGGKNRVAGLRLRATDADWSTGDGPEVAGPCMDLILAMSGRGKALDNCSGEGVATMGQRCQR